MDITYIDFDDEDDPNSRVNHPDKIFIHVHPRMYAMLMPDTGKDLTNDDLDFFYSVLLAAYEQGKSVGRQLNGSE